MEKHVEGALTTGTRFRARRVAPVLAVAALLAFGPALSAKAQLDGWGWNDMPWADGPNGPSGVTGERMAQVCQEVPRVGVQQSDGGVVLDFTAPAGGLPVDRANAWFAEAGLPVEFAVEPTADGAVGRITGHGGHGDVDELALETLARGMGRPDDVLIPESFEGGAWFTLACRPA